MHAPMMAWKTDRIALRLRPEIRDALVRAALDDGRTMSDFVERLLEKELRRAGFLKGELPARYAPGALPTKTMRQVFTAQKARAKQRGIPFEINYDEWCAWWNEDGRWERREHEGLCMARHGDQGGYVMGNIYCTTTIQNSRDAWGFLRKSGRTNRRKPVSE